MTYEEALTYINSVEWLGSRPGLERIRALCEALGHPERSLRFIHIAGTNGKGSVSAMLDAILRAAGYRVGLFTSPYIERFNERIRLNGEDISDDDLAQCTARVKACADALEDTPTVFELITAAALVYFQQVGCDFVVFECGLGGRLDATNVIDTAQLSIITGIALDHCAILGDTTAQVAAEKAGILKPGVPVIFGEGDDDAARVIRQTAEERGCDLIRTDFVAIRDIRPDLTGTTFRFGHREVRIPLVGLYQTRNAATVLTAVDLLRRQGVAISEEAVDAGLAATRWKARFEMLSRDPLVFYDGAHNPQGIAGAGENIRQLLCPLAPDGRVVLLMGVMADKDHREMIGELAPYAAHAIAVRPDNQRSLDAGEVAAEFEACGVPAMAAASVWEGVRDGISLARREKRPLICLGSLYMYGDVKAAVRSVFGE